MTKSSKSIVEKNDYTKSFVKAFKELCVSRSSWSV